jgi:hypothetical protein
VGWTADFCNGQHGQLYHSGAGAKASLDIANQQMVSIKADNYSQADDHCREQIRIVDLHADVETCK